MINIMPNKACTRCGVTKPLEAFYKDRSRPDGRNSQCGDCVMERHRARVAKESPEKREARRKADRERQKEKRRYPTVCACCGVDFESRHRRRIFCSTRCKRRGTPEQQQKTREASRAQSLKIQKWLDEYKLTRGCADCGYNAYPEALQFDHEGPKTANIGELRTSIARIQAEIDRGQCVVRCANCHAVITRRRKREGKQAPTQLA